MKAFTVIDQQKSGMGSDKEYEMLDGFMTQFRTYRDFDRYSDDFYDGFNDICVDENGEMYAVMFRDGEPILWHRCKEVNKIVA